MVAVVVVVAAMAVAGMVGEIGDVEDEGMGKETSMDSVDSRVGWLWSVPPFLRTISAMRRVRGVSWRMRGEGSGGLVGMVV